MARILYDSDALIDHLQGHQILPTGEDPAYSSISRAELFSWKVVDERRIVAFLDPFEEVTVDREIAEEAGRIRRSTRIKLPDALIAASALVTRRQLATRNVRDFRKVKGLRLVTFK